MSSNTAVVSSISSHSTPTLAAIINASKDARDLKERQEYTVDVDRTLAQILLDSLDDKQRRVSPMRVREISQDMEEGRWESTGDPFRMSPEGTLVDGQHRLNAFLKASVPTSFIMEDITIVILKNRKALDVVDIGKTRTVGDLRQLTGREKVPNRAIGGILFEDRDFETNKPMSKRSRNDLIDSHPLLEEAILLSKAGGNTAVIGAAIRCMRIPGASTDALEFFVAAARNEHRIGNKHSVPLQLLATWLISNTHSGGGHYIRRETVVRCIHAWNAFRDGRDIKNLRYYKKSAIPKAR